MPGSFLECSEGPQAGYLKTREVCGVRRDFSVEGFYRRRRRRRKFSVTKIATEMNMQERAPDSKE